MPLLLSLFFHALIILIGLFTFPHSTKTPPFYSVLLSSHSPSISRSMLNRAPQPGFSRSSSERSPSSQTPTLGSSVQPSFGLDANCFTQIHQQVEASLQYPLSLRRRDIQGQVTVKIDLGGQGQVEALQIVKTSGHEELDQLALNAVSHAEPFSCIGGQALGRLSVSLPIQFKLN